MIQSVTYKSRMKGYTTAGVLLSCGLFVVRKGGDDLIKINGEALDLGGRILSDYLAGSNFDPARIAVERNGQIVPKRLYSETVLEDGDVLEIVSFVGGG